jgi:hypothetical protein
VSAPEIEALAVDAIAGETARASRHALPVGSPCPNCATPLAGPWCHECGQKGEEFHRSILHLIAEAFEGLFHFDSRLWNTLPRLVFRPGRLTHDYLDGHRASQVPPFRIFLIVLLLVFFAGDVAVNQNHQNFNLADPNNVAATTKNMSPKEKAEFDKDMAQMRTDLAANPLTAAAQEAAARTAAADAAAGKPPPKVTGDVDVNLGPKNNKRAAWLRSQLQKAIKNPDSFFVAVESWGHRFAILMLPIAALMLTVLFAFRKGVYVFDHVIFSMHSLSFVGLLLTTIFLASIWWGGAWWLLWAAPAHLFIHMRGTYRTGIFGTLARMTLLFIGTNIVVALMVAGLVFVGLASLK